MSKETFICSETGRKFYGGSPIEFGLVTCETCKSHFPSRSVDPKTYTKFHILEALSRVMMRYTESGIGWSYKIPFGIDWYNHVDSGTYKWEKSVVMIQKLFREEFECLPPNTIWSTPFSGYTLEGGHLMVIFSMITEYIEDTPDDFYGVMTCPYCDSNK